MPRSSGLLLVIEAGGSKARAAIAWGGRIMARSLPVGLNLNDIEPDTFRLRLEALILPLLDLPGRPIRSLRVIAALAGAGRPGPRQQCRRTLRSLLNTRAGRLRLKVTSDAEALVDRFLSRSDGIVLVAGTGSICLGTRRTGTRRVTARAGGWGSYFDRGCGFRLGLGALRAALDALDGGEEGSVMVDRLCRRYGLDVAGVPEVFLPVRREQVAKLAPIVLEALGEGDPAARLMARHTVADLVEMVRVIAGRLGLTGRFSVVVSGGLFDNRRLSESFRRSLKRSLPSVSLIHVRDPLACLVS